MLRRRDTLSSVLYNRMVNKRLTNKQKKQLDRLVRENYSNWINIAAGIVNGRDAAEEVYGKAVLYLLNRITSTKGVPIDIPNCAGYMCLAVKCRALNYLRDNSKIMTLSNQDLDKLTSYRKL